MESARYGAISTLGDAASMNAPDGDDVAAVGIDQTGTLLWSYQNEGRINGVPVVEEDRGLMVDSDDMIAAAFVLQRHPKSLLLWLSPDENDKGNAIYSDLLSKAADGEVDIVDEFRQWDAEHSRFVLWVRYDEVEYRLHRRFEFLREG